MYDSLSMQTHFAVFYLFYEAHIYRLYVNSNHLWSIYRSGVNSHAVGMTVARPYGFEIDFVRKSISGSPEWFFVIILERIFTPIFEIEIHEKITMHEKNKN